MASYDPIEPVEPQEAAVPESNAWLTPAKLPVASAPVPAGAPMYDLRPLTLGEVLDRTFSVYRSRFWLFAGIASISGAVQLVAQAVQMFLQHLMLHRSKFVTGYIVGVVALVLVYLAFFLAYSVTQAATAFAVGEIYLGRVTSVKESLQATIGRWLAYIGIALWQLGSMIWLPILLILPAFVLIKLFPNNSGMLVLGSFLMFAGVLGGGVVGYILYLRNSLGVPAAVIERLKVRAAMRRSKALMAGAKGRIFVVTLISACLYMVVGVLQMPFALLMMFALQKGKESIVAQAVTLLIGFLGHSVVTPVAMIGFTLVYFDQRVRKEAFDIAVMLGEEQAVVAGEPIVEQTPAESEPIGGQAGDEIAL